MAVWGPISPMSTPNKWPQRCLSHMSHVLWCRADALVFPCPHTTSRMCCNATMLLPLSSSQPHVQAFCFLVSHPSIHFTIHIVNIQYNNFMRVTSLNIRRLNIYAMVVSIFSHCMEDKRWVVILHNEYDVWYVLPHTLFSSQLITIKTYKSLVKT